MLQKVKYFWYKTTTLSFSLNTAFHPFKKEFCAPFSSSITPNYCFHKRWLTVLIWGIFWMIQVTACPVAQPSFKVGWVISPQKKTNWIFCSEKYHFLFSNVLWNSKCATQMGRGFIDCQSEQPELYWNDRCYRFRSPSL